MATRTIANGGGNWSSAASWVEGAVPKAEDNVVATGTSGNLTIDVEAVCRSIDLTNYVGKLIHNAGFILTIGDGTAGPGNIALKFVAGMTYELGNAASSRISFASTNAATQTVDFGGKITGGVFYAVTTGTVKLLGKHETGTTALVEFVRGGLDTNGQTCKWGLFTSNNNNTRTLTLGASAITITGTGNAWGIENGTGLTISANTATVTMTGAAAAFNSASINYQGMSLVQSGSGLATVAGGGGSITLANYTRTGTAVKTDAIQSSGAVTITSTLTLTGNSATNRLLVQSAAAGTARTFTAAVVSITNADFMDIVGAGAAAPFTGSSLGNCLGNSGITFTTPVTRYWVATGGGLWSATSSWSESSGGASGASVPLPQDTAIVNAASITAGGKTITLDMPRLCADLDAEAVLNSPILAQSVAWSVYGSLKLATGSTLGGGAGPTFRGRSAGHTITSKGVVFTESVVFNGPGGKYTLQDAFSTSNSRLVQIFSGTIDFNGKAVGVGSFKSEGGQTMSVVMGKSTLTLNDTGTILDLSAGSLTVSAAEATIVVGTASASARTMTIGAKTLGTVTYTVAGSTGSLTITHTGATITTLNFSDVTNARTLKLTASQTLTVTTFNVQGTTGKLMTVESSVGGTQATLSKSSGVVSIDFLSLKDSAATGGAAWYAGDNSVNVSGNTGWIFETIQTRFEGFDGSPAAVFTRVLTADEILSLGAATALAANTKHVSAVVVPELVRVPKLTVLLDGFAEGAAGDGQPIKGIIYNEAGTLVAQSEEVIIPPAMAQRWVDLRFDVAGGAVLAPGNYEFGVIAGSGPTARIGTVAGGSRAYGADTYGVVLTKLTAQTTLPAASIPVVSTAGMDGAGIVIVAGQPISYTSIDATHFKGASGGVGVIASGSDALQEGAGLRNQPAALTAAAGSLAIFATYFVEAVLPDIEDAQIARYPFTYAQSILGSIPPLEGSSRVARATWHGTRLNPERGSFMLVQRDGTFSDLVGQRVRVSTFAGKSVYAYVLTEADLNEEDDVSLTRRLFMELGPLSTDSLGVRVETLSTDGV